jgi:hypothetical protein
MATDVEIGRITTDIPARMDRLPWARWHWQTLENIAKPLTPESTPQPSYAGTPSTRHA